jgi:hypothetical protein
MPMIFVGRTGGSTRTSPMGMGLAPIRKSPKTDPARGKRNSSFRMP